MLGGAVRADLVAVDLTAGEQWDDEGRGGDENEAGGALQCDAVTGPTAEQTEGEKISAREADVADQDRLPGEAHPAVAA